jgi:hypothetical protein
MRTLVLSIVAVIAALSLAHAADVYPPPAYGAAPPPAYQPPPPAYGYAPPPAYRQPPVVAYGPPVYGRPPGIIVAPEGPAYQVSEPAYQPGDEYVQGPALVDGRRYYRDCWFEWGYRRCTLRPRWW